MDRRIRAFLAIAKERNISAAARLVGLEQPSLTRLLKKLEAELGAPLFHRLPRGVELTEFGESFRLHALRIEAEYRSASEEIAALKGNHLPHFRIGAGSFYHLAVIPGLVPRLVREFPRTQFEVMGSTTPTMLPMLHRGELDAVIGRTEEGRDRTYGLHGAPLLDVRTGVVMRSDHALRTSQLTRDRLANREWVAHRHDEEIVGQLTRYFETARLPCPRLAVTTTSIETALRIVARSDLLMLAPMQLQAFVRVEGLDVVAPEEPIWNYRSGVFFRRSSLKYPIVARLTGILKEMTAAGRSGPEAHPDASPAFS